VSKDKVITVRVSETVYSLLKVLVEPDGSVEGVLSELIDHAQQGVYRPGAWERNWLIQAFGDDWIKKLEAGDPYGCEGCEHIFQRPRRTS